MTSATPRPPVDPEIRDSLSRISFPKVTNFSTDVVAMMRNATATPPEFVNSLASRGIAHREVAIPASNSTKDEIILSILCQAENHRRSRPCIYWIHGGGLHWGDRLHTLELPTDIILELNAVCVSVEYRRAPEYPFSTAVEDCYMGLQWTREHAEELGIDVGRIMVGGVSAGGGLAAATVLLSRDRKGPEICGQCLICPMLDDRAQSVSSLQFVNEEDFMPTQVISGAWKSALANDQGRGDNIIIPPGRREDLSGLPTAYLDAGSAEVLRDETVAYASKLWEKGVQAELHIWAGGIHGFDMFVPDAAVAQGARKAQIGWIKRVLSAESSR